jgi:hypothetical protein
MSIQINQLLLWIIAVMLDPLTWLMAGGAVFGVGVLLMRFLLNAFAGKGGE